MKNYGGTRINFSPAVLSSCRYKRNSQKLGLFFCQCSKELQISESIRVQAVFIGDQFSSGRE